MRYRVIILIIITLIFTLLTAHLAVANTNILKIKITSFKRTSEEQAILLMKNYEKGIDLITLYKRKELITEIVEILKDSERFKKERIIVIIEKGIKDNKYLSKHLCGKAIDISKNEASTVFIEFLNSVKGLSSIDEGDHYHIRVDSNCKQIIKQL